MGLDSFRTDNGGDSDEDELDTDGEIDERSKNVEEETEQSGLASFKTDKGSDDSDESKDRDKANPWMDDFTSYEWNSMSVKEKVKYVRENYYPEYRPEVELNDDWTYSSAIEIQCVCDNSFTIKDEGMCMNCSRGYKRTNGTVVMKYTPHNIDKQENDNNE